MKRGCVFGSMVVLGLASVAMPAVAEPVFVQAVRGIAMKPGAMLDSEKPLTLKSGQQVTLIRQNGETVEVDGPQDGPLLKKGPHANVRRSLMSILSMLLTEDRSRTNSLGTTRGAASIPLPDPWLIDATESGPACLQEGAKAVFWRPDVKMRANLVVQPDGRTGMTEIPWPAGLDRLAIDAGDPIQSGATYLVTLDGTAAKISIMEVPASLPNDTVRLAWMANLGCTAQARAMARYLR